VRPTAVRAGSPHFSPPRSPPLDTNKAAQQIAKAGEGKIKAPALPAAQALVCTSFFADFCGTGNR
jgi:hypothetical protein